MLKLKGWSQRPNELKTISFCPHSRSTPAYPIPTGLTEDPFFGKHHFLLGKISAKNAYLLFLKITIFEGQNSKSAQKQLVCFQEKSSSAFALILSFENGILRKKKKKETKVLKSIQLFGAFGGGGGTIRPLPRDWGRGGTPRRPNSRATPQGLDHRSRIERDELKIDLRRGSEAGQWRRR